MTLTEESKALIACLELLFFPIEELGGGTLVPGTADAG